MEVATENNSTTPSTTASDLSSASDSGKSAKPELVRLKVSNLHRLVDEDELRKFFEFNQAPVYAFPFTFTN
jgi:RNA recognition motif-containing protein